MGYKEKINVNRTLNEERMSLIKFQTIQHCHRSNIVQDSRGGSRDQIPEFMAHRVSVWLAVCPSTVCVYARVGPGFYIGLILAIRARSAWYDWPMGVSHRTDVPSCVPRVSALTPRKGPFLHTCLASQTARNIAQNHIPNLFSPILLPQNPTQTCGEIFQHMRCIFLTHSRRTYQFLFIRLFRNL